MSRVDSARIAAIKARDAARIAGWPEPRTVGSAVASEAFFPFPDGLLATAEAGATSVIQPGGSMNDQKVIDAADEAEKAGDGFHWNEAFQAISAARSLKTSSSPTPQIAGFAAIHPSMSSLRI